VRTEPSLSSGYVTYLSCNSEVILMNETVTADNYKWAKVQLKDGQIGWTLADFLEPIGN